MDLLKRAISLFVIIVWTGSSFCSSPDSTWANRKLLVYKFDIKEMIAPPIWRKTSKALKEARDKGADIILIHMNTYGGTLDDADSIRTAILKSKIPVYVYIDNNAASAGALISIACDSIYMHPGANIGAATVVDQTGKPMPDKYQSYMRSMMRSTAEVSGRNPDIAQAMVDPGIVIPGITDSSKVLTFTAEEAVKFKFCEGISTSYDGVLEDAGITDYEIVEQKLSALDRFIGFLINPVVSGILIMVIIAGLYFEFQTPGIGFPLFAAVTAALLYFAPLYLEGLAKNWEILIFVIGLILVAIEIFAIPGFGVIGISGIALSITGLTLSMVDNMGFSLSGMDIGSLTKALFTVVISSFLSLILSIYFGRRLLTSSRFSYFTLNTEEKSGEGYSISEPTYVNMLGKSGLAYTILRPSGKIIIEENIYDAVAETGYIEKGEEITVTGYNNAQLTVRKVKG